MNTTNFQKVKHDNSRCSCCGIILYKHERAAGICFAHMGELSYSRRMALRKERKASA